MQRLKRVLACIEEPLLIAKIPMVQGTPESYLRSETNPRYLSECLKRWLIIPCILILCTGVAVTLILEALGVDRETIMEEFLLTNEISRTAEKAVFLSKERKKSNSGKRFSRSPSASAWFPIVGVQAEMLEAFYASVDERYGSMDAFLTELGVDQEARGALAASLTTEQPKIAMVE
jgi:hypothetical protein